MFKVRLDARSPDFQTASRWAMSGLAFQLLGLVVDIPFQGTGFGTPLALYLTAGGTVALLIGTAYLAKSKHRSTWWAVLGLLSLVGWTLVVFLEDHSPEALEAAGQG